MSGWRYVTRAWRDEVGEGWQDRPSITVFEDEDTPINTGIFDPNGAPLYRVRERQPIGFCLERPRYRVKAGSIKA